MIVQGRHQYLESKYQPSGEGGTHSPTATPHRLQNKKWPPGHSGFYLGRSEGGHGDEFEVGITDQLPGQPEEGFLEVVVGLGGDVVVLEVLLAMEYDRLGLHFAILEMQMRGEKGKSACSAV